MMTQNRPKPKENQPGILKIYAFCQIIQQGASSPGGMLLGLRIFYENAPGKLQPVPTKSFCNLVFQGRVQLEHSSYIVKASVKATC